MKNQKKIQTVLENEIRRKKERKKERKNYLIICLMLKDSLILDWVEPLVNCTYYKNTQLIEFKERF